MTYTSYTGQYTYSPRQTQTTSRRYYDVEITRAKINSAEWGYQDVSGTYKYYEDYGTFTKNAAKLYYSKGVNIIGMTSPAVTGITFGSVTGPYTDTQTKTIKEASATITATGLLVSGTTVSINSAYSGKVLVSTDDTIYYYSSGTSLPISLGSSNRTVYTIILDVNGVNLGLVNRSSYLKSNIDTLLKAYNDFDNLERTVTAQTVTVDQLNELNTYITNAGSIVNNSGSEYTTRATKLSTLENTARPRLESELIILNKNKITASFNAIEEISLPSLLLKYGDIYTTGINYYNDAKLLIGNIQNK